MSYNAAIVGCGRIGCFLGADAKRRGTISTHAAAYAACPDTRLVALADVDSSARERAARRWGVPRTYADLETLLKNEDVDILSVCTPSSAHAEALRRAAAAGVSAVLCEKPLAASLKESRELARLLKGRVAAVDHVRRWDRPYELACEWIRKGRLGSVVAATAWYTHGVANIGSHVFDTLRFFFGEAEWVWAAPAHGDDPDPTLSGVVGFAGGVSCHVVGCGREALLFEMDVVGTKGRLRVSENGHKVEAWTVGPSARFPGYREPGRRRRLWGGTDGRRLLKAVEDVVRCLKRGGSPRCGIEDGCKSVELVAAFLSSSRSGRRIDLPLDGDHGIPVR